MQLEPGVLGEPALDVRVVVSRGVIKDEMNVQSVGDLSVDRPQELQEVGKAPAR